MAALASTPIKPRFVIRRAFHSYQVKTPVWHIFTPFNDPRLEGAYKIIACVPSQPLAIEWLCDNHHLAKEISRCQHL